MELGAKILFIYCIGILITMSLFIKGNLVLSRDKVNRKTGEKIETVVINDINVKMVMCLLFPLTFGLLIKSKIKN